MTDDEVRKIAREAADEAVIKTLRGLGINPDEPQRAQANFIYLDKSRRGTEEMARWIKRGCVTSALAGGVWIVWEGAKLAIKQITNGG